MPMHTAQHPDHLVTAEEAFALGTSRRFELRKGVVVYMSPSGAQHGVVAMTIGSLLHEYVRRAGLGVVVAAETGFILARNPDTVRAADAAFVSKDRFPPGGPPIAFWPLAPDLAVEVVSPSESSEDIQEKVQDYLAAGTRLVWVVYPKTRSATVYRSLHDARILRGDEVVSGEDVLPGFTCPVSRFFE